MKDCPVCGKGGVADNARECAQCNADLECFDLLDSLHEEVVTLGRSEPGLACTKELENIRVSLNGIRETLERWHKSGWMRTYGMAALFASGIAALLLLLYRDFSDEHRLDGRISQLEARTSPVDVEAKTKELSGLIAKTEAITQRLDAMENGLSAVSANQEAVSGRFSVTLEELNKMSERLASLQEGFPALTAERSSSAAEPAVPSDLAPEDMFVYHEPRNGDTLWSIARRHYDNGRFYPVLLEHNPGLGIYFDPGYGRIKILKNRRLAEEVLADVIAVREGRTGFRYKVVEGDTWERISERFFGQVNKATELARLNSPVDLVPGQRVFVPLP
jgi:LysM repeat protein